MLDIIAKWDTSAIIPDTVRGQPKNWKRSNYNSITNAKTTFEELIKNTNSNYILISYNNTGIIKPEDMHLYLNKYGLVIKHNNNTQDDSHHGLCYYNNVNWTNIVKQGDIIGTVGSSGRSTGPHLDIRLNWFGTRLDPQTILN